jgi:hypothetical protein
MPTGWRPADVIEKYPIEMIKDVYQFDKFTTQANRVLKLWSSYQLVITVALSLFMFYNYEAIGFNNLLFYGLMIFIGIYGYTTLMDRRRYAVIIEIIRSLIGLAVINYTGDWFGLNDFLMFGSQIVALYFISTIIGALYFTFIEKDFGTTKQEQI